MNAGLSSLALLKGALLAAQLAEETTYDDAIALLGQGVAGHFERLTNRRFYRTVGDTHQVSAEKRYISLPRFPVETLTSIELRTGGAGSWIAQDLAGLLAERDDAAGLLEFQYSLGNVQGAVRVTWTGGWWWDTTEDASETQPVGSTALPAELRNAWVLQCQHIWARRDNLGVGITQAPDKASKLADLDLLPYVRNVLLSYVRHG